MCILSRDLVLMQRGCARRRRTGKPLQIAVDGVSGTTAATTRRLVEGSIRLLLSADLAPQPYQSCAAVRQPAH